eukprot:3941880-Rhodomonas_salina.3
MIVVELSTKQETVNREVSQLLQEQEKIKSELQGRRESLHNDVMKKLKNVESKIAVLSPIVEQMQANGIVSQLACEEHSLQKEKNALSEKLATIEQKLQCVTSDLSKVDMLCSLKKEVSDLRELESLCKPVTVEVRNPVKRRRFGRQKKDSKHE